MIAQPDLLDDIVGRAPGFDLASLGQPVDRLMMRAVDHFKAMRGGAIIS